MPYRIRVAKQLKKSKPFYKMWQGRCTCGRRWQFWFWGATLGYGIEHLWRHQ